MSSYCSLDRLPVELLQIIFNYFFAHELLYSFTDVSAYIDAVLLNYSFYRVNVHRISIDQLDQIDLYLRSDQIIALTLSDDIPITEAFFSRFHIEQFTRLRSLKLEQIEYNTIPLVFTHLERLKSLRSLSFDTSLVKHQYPAWNDDYRHESIRFNRFLQSCFNKILPRLTYVRLNSLQISTNSLVPLRLQHLILKNCSFYELNHILQRAPRLQFIDICLCSNNWNASINFSSNHLKEFRLNITGNPVSFEQIKQLLEQFQYLKKLVLECHGQIDLLDGYRWQSITRRLVSFDFKIKFLNPIEIDQSIMISFSNEYWLKEKNWLVVSNGQQIFTIPYFLPDSIDLSEQNSSIYPFNHDKISKIVLRSPTFCHHYRYTSVKYLELHCSLSWKMYQSIFDSNRLVSLSIDSFDQLRPFLPFALHLPNLTELSIDQHIAIDSIMSDHDYSWKRLRQLKLCTIYDNDRYILEKLFRLFPSIESLVYVSRELTTKLMIHMVNGFDDLLTASFHTDATFTLKENESCRNPDLFIDRLARFTRESISCRVYHTINSRLSLHIDWHIHKQTKTQSPWKQTIDQAVYRCNKYKYSMERILSKLSRIIQSYSSLIVSSVSILLCIIIFILLLCNISIDVHFLYDFISNAIVCYLIDRLRHQFKTRNHIIVHLCLCVIVFVLSQMIRALCLRLPS